MTEVASFAAAVDRARVLQDRLREREEADLRDLLTAQPFAVDGVVWWATMRRAEPFEVEPPGDDVAVIVSATATGLTLRVERRLYRCRDGSALPLDLRAFGRLHQSGALDDLGAAPAAKREPEVGLRLRVELEECRGRERVCVEVSK